MTGHNHGVSFLVLIPLFFAIVPIIEGQYSPPPSFSNKNVPENISEEVGSYLSDAKKWVWPTAHDPNAENLIYTILSSWCGDTYVDAVRDASSKTNQFEKLRTERDQRYSEWMRCQQERTIREREIETECERSRQLQSSAFDRERSVLKTECESETSFLQADLEACELKLKKKETSVCQKEVQLEKVNCEHAKRGLQANLTACEERSKGPNVTRIVQLEELALRYDEEGKLWERQKKDLVAEISECRPARAHAESRLKEVLADGTIATLENTVVWLQTIVLGMLVLLFIATFTVLYLMLQDSRHVAVGEHGALAVQPFSRLKLMSADAARELLTDVFENRKGGRLSIILTTEVNFESEAGPPTVFLLVPVNVSSSRRFSLFNSGGDYTAHVERAQELVSKNLPKNSRLVVVLYEGNGCVFTEHTLQSLRLTADKVAYEAVPKDVDFPKSHNLVVLWLDKQEGLRATDSERESDLTTVIKLQPWAQYLLMRSGRWGQVHAQFL